MTSAGRASATTAKTTSEPMGTSTTAHFNGSQPERIRRSNPLRAMTLLERLAVGQGTGPGHVRSTVDGLTKRIVTTRIRAGVAI